MKALSFFKPSQIPGYGYPLILSLGILLSFFLSGSFVLPLIGLFVLWSVFILLTTLKNRVKRISRWAKHNPVSSQFIIAGIQLCLSFMALMLGKNLLEMGVTVGTGSLYILAAILLICFMSVPFFPKKEGIVVPVILLRRRVAYLGITLSAFLMMMIAGNNIEKILPGSVVSSFVDKVDQRLFSTQDMMHQEKMLIQELGDINAVKPHGVVMSETIHLSSLIGLSVLGKEQKKGFIRKKVDLAKSWVKIVKQKMRSKLRLIAASGTCIAAILGILALVVLVCAGVCLIIFGLEGDIILVFAGAALTALSIWGIIELAKLCRGPGKSSG